MRSRQTKQRVRVCRSAVYSETSETVNALSEKEMSQSEDINSEEAVSGTRWNTLFDNPSKGDTHLDASVLIYLHALGAANQGKREYVSRV